MGGRNFDKHKFTYPFDVEWFRSKKMPKKGSKEEALVIT